MKTRQAKLVAHRGWSSKFPENSLAALTAGFAAGADEIEFDLRLSKDGVPFLCHDDVVDRVSLLVGPCESFTMQELSRADIKGPDGTVFEHLGFSSIDDVFNTFGNRIGMNVHIKDSHKTREILTYITARYDLTEFPDMYIAGDAQMLEVAVEEFKEIPRCCLADAVKDPELLLSNALKFKCVRLQFRKTNYTKPVVAKALAAGLIPNLFFADSLEDARQAVDYGIVGILTNDIGYLEKHLDLRKTI